MERALSTDSHRFIRKPVSTFRSDALEYQAKANEGPCASSLRRSPPRPTPSRRCRPTAPASRWPSTPRPGSIRKRRRCAPRRWWRCAGAPRRTGFTLIEGTATWAEPAGSCSARPMRRCATRSSDSSSAALPVDAVVLGLHGAMVAQGYDDCEGDLLARVRAIVGPGRPRSPPSSTRTAI